jgi:hypothetical protein
MLFYNAVLTTVVITAEWDVAGSTGKYVKGCGRDLFKDIILVLSWTKWWKTRELSKNAGLRLGMWTEYLANTTNSRYNCDIHSIN